MSVMQDRDAANTMPGGGDRSIVNGASYINTHVFVDSPPIQQEALETPNRILVVEDDTSLATLEAHFLAAYNFTVVISTNGETAVTTLESFMPDIVLLDLELRGSLSGWY